MKHVVTVACVVLVMLAATRPVSASDASPDLSSPESSIKAFFTAIRSGDIDEVKKTIPKRFPKVLEGFKENTLQDFVRGWRKYPLKEIRNARMLDEDSAAADVVLLINGIETSYHVELSKEGDSWRWESYRGFLEIEGALTFEVREAYPEVHTEGDPAVFLFLTTDRIYSCWGFNVRAQVALNNRDVSVSVLDVEEPAGCLRATGPANARFMLRVPKILAGPIPIILAGPA